MIFPLVAQQVLSGDLFLDCVKPMEYVGRWIDPTFRAGEIFGSNRSLAAPYEIGSLTLNIHTSNGRDVRVGWFNLDEQRLATIEWDTVVTLVLKGWGFTGGKAKLGFISSRAGETCAFEYRQGPYIVATGTLTANRTTLTLNMPWYNAPSTLPPPLYSKRDFILLRARALLSTLETEKPMQIDLSDFILGHFGVPRNEQWRSPLAQEQLAAGRAMPLFTMTLATNLGMAHVVANAVTGEVYLAAFGGTYWGWGAFPRNTPDLRRTFWCEGRIPIKLKPTNTRPQWRTREFLIQEPWLLTASVDATRQYVELNGTTYQVSTGTLPLPKPIPVKH